MVWEPEVVSRKVDSSVTACLVSHPQLLPLQKLLVHDQDQLPPQLLLLQKLLVHEQDQLPPQLLHLPNLLGAREQEQEQEQVPVSGSQQLASAQQLGCSGPVGWSG